MQRIAITGLSRAGKSAFLTALLWNIEHEMAQKQKDFRSFSALKKYKDMSYEEVTDSDLLKLLQTRAPLTPFLLDRKIDEFKSGSFPSKTTNCESICFKLKGSFPQYLSVLNPIRSSKHLYFDFPGERLEDALINEQESYAQWADEVHEYLHGEKYPRCRELSKEYRDLLHHTETSPAAIIASYKELLYAFAKEALPVSPSSFMLSAEGQRTKKSNYQEAICGLSAEDEFVPLTDNWKDTELYKKMEQSYQQYKKALVAPVFNLVKTADVLIVLLDITDILKGGYQRYRSSLEWLNKIPQICKPSFITNPFNLGIGIKKVAFVATQSDRVLREDTPHLEQLLQQLTRKATKDLIASGFSHDDVKRYYCSACVSTVLVEDGKLAAFFGGEKRAYTPERIPENWPTGIWDSKAPIPYPSPPPIRGDVPPQSINLDQILKFIME